MPRLAALVLSALVPLQAAARQERADPLRFFAWPVQDAAGLVSGVSRGELYAAAGAGATLAFLSRFDRDLTGRIAGVTEGAHVSIIEEFGNVKVVRPIGAAILIGAFMSGDDRFQDAAFTSLEAVVYSNLLTNVLKSALGRARPNQEKGPGSFRPFVGGTSFPSGHATTAFAFLSPWALYYPGPMSAGLFVVATATAFSRMATNFHWFSDVVGGSAVGFFTAWALVRRHQGGNGTPAVGPVFGPAGPGLEIRF